MKAILAFVLSVFVLIALVSTSYAAPVAVLQPGFCQAAPSEVRSFASDTNAESVEYFANCAELAALRAKRRDTLETFGSVSILRDRAAQPVLAAVSQDAGAQDLDVNVRAMAAALTTGKMTALGLAQKGENIRVSAYLVTSEHDGSPRVRMIALTALPGLVVRRQLEMPYKNGDTLRYALASLHASAIADQIALANH
ncbi:MAG: hypothetical protein MRY63_01200 [Neomegalonema sp.]|nr:hypothetical protein [Neomegalonema sp.]